LLLDYEQRIRQEDRVLKEESEKIRDLPSLKDMKKDIDGINSIAKLFNFFEKIGLKNEKISRALKAIPELKSKFEHMRDLPDRFNSHFSDKGWIAFDSMNVDLMSDAVKLADSGHFDEAESILVNYYEVEENLRFHLNCLKAIEEYRAREILVKKATEDYKAERYHAFIPVILTVIDGIVNDVTDRGFFAQGVELKGWDCVAAHNSGLQKLNEIFNTARKKTRTEEITLPYRHGILHGRDLGYANKIVAAKCWAALFAIRDWALSLKKANGSLFTQKPKRSLSEILREKRELNEYRKKLDHWAARELLINVDVPENGNPDEYEENCPEKRLAEFFHYWKLNNYGYMTKCFRALTRDPFNEAVRRVRENYGKFDLKNFRFCRIFDKAPAISIINVDIEFVDKKTACELNYNLDVEIIYEKDSGEIMMRGLPDGSWSIVEGSFFHIKEMYCN
jgi:hypothetical protein